MNLCLSGTIDFNDFLVLMTTKMVHVLAHIQFDAFSIYLMFHLGRERP